ncbi:hypothetical protein FRC19_001677 [Serendipita sp. 401]|nr:hypothetical protein FRC19_001677 [Serendipita sp. 401]
MSQTPGTTNDSGQTSPSKQVLPSSGADNGKAGSSFSFGDLASFSSSTKQTPSIQQTPSSFSIEGKANSGFSFGGSTLLSSSDSRPKGVVPQFFSSSSGTGQPNSSFAPSTSSSLSPESQLQSPFGRPLEEVWSGPKSSSFSFGPLADAFQNPFTESPGKKKLRSLYVELKILRKTMREELDRFKTLQREMQQPEVQEANIKMYEEQIVRLKKEKEEARRLFQSSVDQYKDSHQTISNILRNQYDQNQKLIDDQIRQWEQLSSPAVMSLESLKRSHSSNEIEFKTIRTSLLVHAKMKAALIGMINEIEIQSAPSSKEPYDEIVKSIEWSLREYTHAEQLKRSEISTSTSGDTGRLFPTTDKSSEA